MDPLQQMRRRLALVLIIFFGATVVPLYLLLGRVEDQLQMQAYFEQRSAIEDLFKQANKRMQELLVTEDRRPFAEYSFINIAGNKLVQQMGLSFSPLSQYPPDSSIPGIVGYFQIDPDGSFHSPVLPELNIGQNAPPELGLSKEELRLRQELKTRLEAIVNGPLKLSRAGEEDREEIVVAAGFRAEEGRSQLLKLLVPEALAQPSYSEDLIEKSGGAKSGQQAAPRDLLKQEPVKRKLSDYDIDSRMWLKQQQQPELKKEDRAASYDSGLIDSIFRSSRKEQVVVPKAKDSLKTLSNMLQGSRSYEEGEADTGGAPGGNQALRQQESLPASSSEAKDRGISLLSFEGEIDPLKFRISTDDYFVFYRKVWHNKQRYIQGFVCKGQELLTSLVSEVFVQSRFAPATNLLVAANNNVLRRFSPLAPGRAGDAEVRQILLFRGFLLPPLDGLEFVFTAHRISAGPEQFVVTLLIGTIIFVLCAGSLAIYSLAVKQAKLAKERSNFISAVSHELRTPLTSIRMYAEMLRAGWVKEEAKAKTYYDFIFGESERLSRLINNVLQLSKITNDNLTIEAVDFTPAEVLKLVKQTVEPAVLGAGFRLEVKQEEKGVTRLISADRDALVSIFVNLVDNALKFSAKAETRTIEIGCRLPAADRREVVFYVRDFGPGVEKSELRRVFKLFYRGEDELTRTTPGTGIGLALVRELAEKMKARVDVQNKNPGAEFRVVFSAVD